MSFTALIPLWSCLCKCSFMNFCLTEVVATTEGPNLRARKAPSPGFGCQTATMLQWGKERAASTFKLFSQLHHDQLRSLICCFCFALRAVFFFHHCDAPSQLRLIKLGSESLLQGFLLLENFCSATIVPTHIMFFSVCLFIIPNVGFAGRVKRLPCQCR